MKTTRQTAIALAATALLAIGIVTALQAQTDAQVSTDDTLQPVPPENIPATAAFFRLSDYLANGGTLGPPYPFLMNTNAPVFSLNGMAFLVDDASITNV